MFVDEYGQVPWRIGTSKALNKEWKRGRGCRIPKQSQRSKSECIVGGLKGPVDGLLVI